jgi:hypothetical protein
MFGDDLGFFLNPSIRHYQVAAIRRRCRVSEAYALTIASLAFGFREVR